MNVIEITGGLIGWLRLKQCGEANRQQIASLGSFPISPFH